MEDILDDIRELVDNRLIPGAGGATSAGPQVNSDIAAALAALDVLVDAAIAALE